MLSYIRGTLAEKDIDYVVIDCCGVGFKIFTSLHSMANSKFVIGNEVCMHTHMYIKEEIMDLYGFADKDELKLFELLISVNGVGAKGALAILSSSGASNISLAIASGDVDTIKKAPGIGPKTAQRIILELKDKIDNSTLVSNSGDTSGIESLATGTVNDEAVSALIALGYSATEAKNAVSKISGESVEEVIKLALKNLM